MSVTISVRNAPTHKESRECVCVYDAPDANCFYCKGSGVMEEDVTDGAFPVNMSNMNAGAILRLLGFEGEDLYGGQIELADIPAVRRKIMVLRSAQWARSPAVRLPWEGQTARMSTNADGMACISNGPRIIECGLDDEYVLGKLAAIEALLVEAQTLGTSVTWC